LNLKILKKLKINHFYTLCSLLLFFFVKGNDMIFLFCQIPIMSFLGNHCQKNFFCLFVFYVYYYYYYYYYYYFVGGMACLFVFYVHYYYFFFFNDIFLFCQIPITSFLGMLKRGFTSILKLLQCNHCQKNFFVLLHFVIVESLDMQISHVQGTL
jgi:hypothetical protein